MSGRTVKPSFKQDKMAHSGKPPKHVKYKEYLERLGSFVAWPIKYVPKTPEELSTAGFFYIGSADRVTCFQCGITLRDWESEHDAITEHKRYSAECDFINRADMSDLGVSERKSMSGHLLSGASNIVSDVESTATRQNNTGSFECLSTSHTPSGFSNTESTPRSESKAISEESLFKDQTINNHSYANLPHPTGERQTVHVSSTSASEGEGGHGYTKTVKSDQVVTAAQETPDTSQHALHLLLTEKKRLQEQRTCRVCRNKDTAILFLPCGHLVTCPGCAETVHDCVVCGQKILVTVKTYLS